MADDGSHQRKPNLRSAVEDVKALATVLVLKLESVLGRRLKLRSPAGLFAVGVVVTIVLAVGVVLALLRTGNAKAVSDNAPLIAAVIALGGVGTAQMVSIALEQQRTQEARDLETQRVREAALQNYFENVGELLIEKPLHRARPGDNLSTVVRAQTLSVLEGLDPDRKRILLLFLYESGLIYERKLVVSLVAANLRDINLRGANLEDIHLRKAILSSANLSEASLNRANLSRTNLRWANLSRTNLSEASLRGANLRGADLSGAHLNRANLSGAVGLTDEQIAAAASLKGATMPNGPQYED
jgi:uncharacterized protein YjbI with pentapeptide repeats